MISGARYVIPIKSIDLLDPQNKKVQVSHINILQNGHGSHLVAVPWVCSPLI